MNNLSGKTAILYRRVSTTEQKDFGMSLSNQTERLQDFCKRNSVEIIGDFEEDYSAKNFSRPNFSEMLKFVVKNKNRIDYLLIYKWDRFSRNAMEAMNMISQFKGLGVEVNCSDQWINHEDPNQLIMLLLNLGMPQVDNMIRKDRTVEGTRNNLKAGRWVLNQPKGYLKGRDEMGKVLMKPDPEIATLISDLFKDFALGIYSQNEIRQLVKYKKLKLSKSGVSRILNQIIYSGQIKFLHIKTSQRLW
jgi:site-specific DNA recombinase